MLARHHLGQFFAIVGHAQALAHLLQELDAAPFMADVAGQHVGGRAAFAQVVHQAGHAHGQRHVQPGRHVHHQHHVHARVDFGVVFRALGHAPKAIQFGQKDFERTAVPQHLEHAGGLGRHQAFGQFLPDALGHQVVHLAVLDHLPHQGHGVTGHRKVGKARRKTCQPQDAYWVLGKGLGDMAQHLGLQVA